MATEHLSTMAGHVLASQALAMQALANASLHGLSKVTHLNSSLAKTSVEESVVMMRALLQARDVNEAAALMNAQWAPNTAKALAYGRHLASISASLQDEIRQVGQQQLDRTRQELSQAQGEAAPAEAQGLQAVLGLVDNASQGYTQAAEAARSAGKSMQDSLDVALERWMDAASRSWWGAVRQGQQGS